MSVHTALRDLGNVLTINSVNRFETMQAHHCTKLVQRACWVSGRAFAPAVGCVSRCTAELSLRRPDRRHWTFKGSRQSRGSRSMSVSAAQETASTDQVCHVSARPNLGWFNMPVVYSSQTQDTMHPASLICHCLQVFTLVGSGRVGTALAKLGSGSDVLILRHLACICHAHGHFCVSANTDACPEAQSDR